MAYSEDRVAETSLSTFAALQAKHPPLHPLSSIPDLVDVPDGPISVPPETVSSAIRSFPHGSAGDPDGLRPQHLKDLLGAAVIEGNPSHHLLIALTSFTNLVPEGRTPPSICPAFFGASLIALDKKGGGIKPIAVGSTLPCLVAKAAFGTVRSKMVALLAPASWASVSKEVLMLQSMLPDAISTTSPHTRLLLSSTSEMPLTTLMKAETSVLK